MYGHTDESKYEKRNRKTNSILEIFLCKKSIPFGRKLNLQAISNYWKWIKISSISDSSNGLNGMETSLYRNFLLFLCVCSNFGESSQILYKFVKMQPTLQTGWCKTTIKNRIEMQNWFGYNIQMMAIFDDASAMSHEPRHAEWNIKLFVRTPNANSSRSPRVCVSVYAWLDESGTRIKMNGKRLVILYLRSYIVRSRCYCECKISSSIPDKQQSIRVY